MLRASGINPAAKLEQARRVPFGGVGHDLSKEILKALGLFAYLESNSIERWDNMVHLEDSGDKDRVGVREAEEGRSRL